MIEQSFQHGAVYLSQVRGNMLTSKAVKITDLSFGPWRHTRIAKKEPFVYVQDVNTEIIYLYESNNLQVESTTLDFPSNVDQFYYYYGMAYHKRDGEFPYFIQNRPQVSYDGIPSIETFDLPRTLQDLGYDRKFTYPKEIKKLLGNLPATYVDRFKRPINHTNGRTFPVNIEKVKTTLSDLKESNYPFVINIANTDFAMVDLEPNYTKDDLEHFNSLEGYYIESTPRGGKHLLVKAKSDLFKFRYSDELEIINEGMISIYGIDGEYLSNNPKEIDLSAYRSTKRTVSQPIKAKESDKEIQKYVDLLEEKNKKLNSTGRDIAERKYEQNDDLSYAEYLVIYILYSEDIEPYKNSLPKENLPWIVEAYARKTIPWRDKHESQRNKVPYLVHLANEVIQYKEREAENI